VDSFYIAGDIKMTNICISLFLNDINNTRTKLLSTKKKLAGHFDRVPSRATLYQEDVGSFYSVAGF